MTCVCVFVHIYIQLHLGIFLKTVIFYLQFDYVLDMFIHLCMISIRESAEIPQVILVSFLLDQLPCCIALPITYALRSFLGACSSFCRENGVDCKAISVKNPP